MYLILWQTFFPAGSRVCEEDSEQQSRALRALRRSFISTQSPKTKLLCLKSSLSVCSRLPSFLSTCSPPVRGSTMRGSISFCLPSTLPSFPFSPSLSLLWVVLWLQRSQRGRSPRVSPSHFLGKSEPLPSIQPDTELFKDGRTLTHKTRHTHWWGTNTHPWCSPFSQNPLLIVFQDMMKNAFVLLISLESECRWNDVITVSSCKNVCFLISRFFKSTCCTISFLNLEQFFFKDTGEKCIDIISVFNGFYWIPIHQKIQIFNLFNQIASTKFSHHGKSFFFFNQQKASIINMLTKINWKQYFRKAWCDCKVRPGLKTNNTTGLSLSE